MNKFENAQQLSKVIEELFNEVKTMEDKGQDTPIIEVELEIPENVRKLFESMTKDEETVKSDNKKMSEQKNEQQKDVEDVLDENLKSVINAFSSLFSGFVEVDGDGKPTENNENLKSNEDFRKSENKHYQKLNEFRKRHEQIKKEFEDIQNKQKEEEIVYDEDSMGCNGLCDCECDSVQIYPEDVFDTEDDGYENEDFLDFEVHYEEDFEDDFDEEIEIDVNGEESMDEDLIYEDEGDDVSEFDEWLDKTYGTKNTENELSTENLVKNNVFEVENNEFEAVKMLYGIPYDKKYDEDLKYRKKLENAVTLLEMNYKHIPIGVVFTLIEVLPKDLQERINKNVIQKSLNDIRKTTENVDTQNIKNVAFFVENILNKKL